MQQQDFLQRTYLTFTGLHRLTLHGLTLHGLQHVGAGSQHVGAGSQHVGAGAQDPHEVNEWWLPHPPQLEAGAAAHALHPPQLGAGAAAQPPQPPHELTAVPPQQSAAASAGARTDTNPKIIIIERTCFIELLRYINLGNYKTLGGSHCQPIWRRISLVLALFNRTGITPLSFPVY